MGEVTFCSYETAVSGTIKYVNGNFTSLKMDVPPTSIDALEGWRRTRYEITVGDCGVRAEHCSYNMLDAFSTLREERKRIAINEQVLGDITEVFATAGFSVEDRDALGRSIRRGRTAKERLEKLSNLTLRTCVFMSGASLGIPLPVWFTSRPSE